MSGLVLLVDDEQDLLESLDYALKKEGFQTRLARTGREALERALEKPPPELVVLDLMLPDLPGTEVCRQLRQQATTRDVPIVMLTARGEEIDRVVGFEVGADDYVVKPFSVRELVLRLRAILRRAHSGEEPVAPQSFGRLRVDPSGHRVWVDDEEVTLTALEFRLLLTLFSRRGRVQSRDQLLAEAWGITADVTTRTVDTHVKRLRQKLGAAADYVETLRGVGYRFRARLDEE
ncbi:MAG: response regulator transcription factor [Deltaproteobacteria bacterium]|nr:response regulator transcription factor [Deltaproteobacteria bacterium]